MKKRRTINQLRPVILYSDFTQFEIRSGKTGGGKTMAVLDWPGDVDETAKSAAMMWAHEWAAQNHAQVVGTQYNIMLTKGR